MEPSAVRPHSAERISVSNISCIVLYLPNVTPTESTPPARSSCLLLKMRTPFSLSFARSCRWSSKKESSGKPPASCSLRALDRLFKSQAHGTREAATRAACRRSRNRRGNSNSCPKGGRNRSRRFGEHTTGENLASQTPQSKPTKTVIPLLQNDRRDNARRDRDKDRDNDEDETLPPKTIHVCYRPNRRILNARRYNNRSRARSQEGYWRRVESCRGSIANSQRRAPEQTSFIL